MACQQCGAACQGRLCSFCLFNEERIPLGQTAGEEDDRERSESNDGSRERDEDD